MQMNVGIVNNEARITHIADRNRNWQKVAEPVIPPMIRAERAKEYVNKTRSDLRAIHDGLRLTGQVYTRSPTTMFMVIGGTQLTGGRRCDLTYDYDYIVLKDGYFDYTLVGDIGFGNDGLDGRIQLAWDDTGNRIQQATVARYEIDVTKVGGRVLFSAQVNFRRVNNNKHVQFVVRGFLFGGNANRVTLAGIGFTQPADFNMNAHLVGTW